MDPLFVQIEEGMALLGTLRPLPPEGVAELRQRHEVSLTHHSTALEGTTLTQSETQLVLEKGITVGGKPLHDHLEVIGHRDALTFIQELAADHPITESVLHQIHSLAIRGQDQVATAWHRSL